MHRLQEQVLGFMQNAAPTRSIVTSTLTAQSVSFANYAPLQTATTTVAAQTIVTSFTGSHVKDKTTL